MLQERGGEGRGGALHRARDERTNERNEGREEGGEGEEEEESQFSNGPGESGGLYTTFTDLHYPRIAPTLDTHHRPPQIVPLQRRARDGRTDGWTAGRPLLPRHRCDPLSDTPPPSHLPQPRPCVSFARRNYVTVARTSRPKFSFSARTWIVR